MLYLLMSSEISSGVDYVYGSAARYRTKKRKCHKLNDEIAQAIDWHYFYELVSENNPNRGGTWIVYAKYRPYSQKSWFKSVLLFQSHIFRGIWICSN